MNAWAITRETPNLVWLVLTKRPERIEKHLPSDWPYANVWLGVSTGCRRTLNKMDVLRRIPIARNNGLRANQERRDSA